MNLVLLKGANKMRYSMSKKMFDTILRGRTGEDKKKHPFVYVLEVVNREFGIKGEVKSIAIHG